MKLPDNVNDIIAEKIIGMEPAGFMGHSPMFRHKDGMVWLSPRFDFDLEAAFRLVTFLREDGWIITLIGSQTAGWDCHIKCGPGARGKFYSDLMDGEMYTLPQAVCVAALRAYDLTGEKQ